MSNTIRDEEFERYCDDLDRRYEEQDQRHIEERYAEPSDLVKAAMKLSDAQVRALMAELKKGMK